MNQNETKDPQPLVKPGSPQQDLPVSSQALFRNSNELVIEHDGQHYRLRITRHNKLILTK
jgi:hemin uptake protein HemP